MGDRDASGWKVAGLSAMLLLRIVGVLALAAFLGLIIWVVVSCSTYKAPEETAASVSASSTVSSLPAGIWSETAGTTGVLTDVVVQTDENLVTVQAKGPTPQAGTTVYSVRAGSYTLGLKVVDGAATRYVYDFTSSSQQTFESSYAYADGVVAFRFPKSAVPGLDAGAQWQGTLTQDGQQTDQTPWTALG